LVVLLSCPFLSSSSCFSFSFLTPFSSFSFYLFPQDNAKAAAASAAAAAAKKAAEDAAIAETEQREGKLARA